MSAADRSLRVLLVEDDEDDYLLIRDWLSSVTEPAMRLERVASYEAALEAMCRNAHDMYLLDYRLGKDDGLKLLRQATAAGCKGPAIVLTGQGSREVDLEAMRAGALDFLPKDQLSARSLERAVRYALARRRTEEQLRQARDELEQRVRERTAALAEANEALRERQQKLADAARRKDEFLMMLAHELRNPLAPIRTGLQLLGVSGNDRQAVDKVRAMMERQIGHLGRIVDDLLEVARTTHGKMELRPRRLDLGRLARVTAADAEPNLRAAGLTLDLDVPDVPVWVRGDPTRLVQILDNLLQNAVKFTEPGGRVGVRVQADLGLRQAVLTVWDTGVGLGPGIVSHLFEPFAQADRSLDRSKGGLGLGLALVKGLVELHGGQVRATSAGPGRGAEFTVTLLLEPEPAVLSADPVPSPPPARKLRILVVEDHRDSAETLRMLLEHYRYEVVVAYSGPDGVRAAQDCKPDVILCDIGLPGLDGYGVAGAVRADPATASARLIAVTGYGAEEDRRRSQEAGFDQHLTKPVDPQVLLALLAPSPN